MVVSFWNCSGTRSGVTTSVASVSLFYALRFKKRAALFENHVPNGLGLSDLLIHRKKTDSVFEEPVFYNQKTQIHYLYGLLRSGYPLSQFTDAAITLANGKLHYYPQNFYGNHDLLDYELNKIIDPFLDELLLRYETVFVDLKQFHTMTTKKVLERSDLIFLILPPESEALDAFFFNHEADLSKVYYVFTKYGKEFGLAKETLLEAYPLSKDRVSYLPYSDFLYRNCAGGNLVGYLKKHKWATVGEKSFDLMFELRKMTSFIKVEAEKKREREDAYQAKSV